MLKRLGQYIFKFYCHPDFQEDILGDLEEYYEFNSEQKGNRYANRKFLIDVLLLFRLSLLRENWFTRNTTFTIMVKNNIKVAYRSMMRHKFYSFLNLSGLAVSMAACIFIAIYVKDELSYDKHFQDSERIYRIANYLKFADNEFNLPTAPDPMAKTLKDEFPEIEEAGRFRGDASMIVQVDENFYQQDHITWMDQALMNIFNFPVIQGNSAHLLDEPNTVVLTETTAIKFFGDTDVLGKTIKVNDQTDLKVSGVIADIPSNSHLQFNMFITMLNRPDARQNFWLSNNFVTYVKLQRPDQVAAFDEKMPDFLLRHMGSQVKQFMNADMQAGIDAGRFAVRYFLQPIEQIHLTSNLDSEFGETGTIQYVYMFSVIGFFILLIACINFTNMATARASVRAKEVGVRKVLGSVRKQLINQFLTESLLSAFLSLFLAIGIVLIMLPGFNQLTEKSLINPVFSSNGLWPYLLLGTTMVGLMAGIYPAFVLSSHKPVKVLKGEVSKGRKSQWMRNILVVIQFATSIFLIIGTILVYNQLSYLQNKELGFNKDQVLVINETQLLGDQIDAFKTELERNPIINSVSISGYIPAADSFNDFPMMREEATSPDEAVSTQNWYVDNDYAQTYDLDIIQGRFFSDEIVSDSNAVVINQTAVRRFGYTDEEAVGKKIKTLNGVVNNQSEVFSIIGVVKDFHFRTMTDVIQPQVLYLGRSNGCVSIQFNPEATAEVVKVAENTWTEMANGRPFEYFFLDQLFKNQFSSQERTKTIFSVFAILAIVIACLGLFALAAFVTEQRKKEIGIRKVLGASTFKLLSLLFNNFTWLILISGALAVPFAWWYMDGWLSEYPFRIDLSPFIFILGVSTVLLISWLTVGYQSLRAARRNPIENLRYE